MSGSVRRRYYSRVNGEQCYRDKYQFVFELSILITCERTVVITAWSEPCRFPSVGEAAATGQLWTYRSVQCERTPANRSHHSFTLGCVPSGRTHRTPGLPTGLLLDHDSITSKYIASSTPQRTHAGVSIVLSPNKKRKKKEDRTVKKTRKIEEKNGERIAIVINCTRQCLLRLCI